MSKVRGINADIQAPRTKLLYLIYSAPHSRVNAIPGVKSQICSALGYKSDGHFHHDWNYLISSGMIEEKNGYFAVTEDGKKEFALHSTASRSNSVMVIIGSALILFTFLLQWKIVPVEGVAAFGFALIFLGSLFSMLNRRNTPDLPFKARVLLKKLR
ncbi:MAG: hypothetical protein NWF05_06055 [Candidatus Bathyarchaeota archaeon]|nr:hypothetical protein [Candidatus Bathyarchaeota archaeon]